MSVDNHNAVMNALAASLAAFAPARHVQRSLVDPANETSERLMAGVICLVSDGGGDFATYRGREGDLGKMTVRAVAFVQVAESAVAADVETAEFSVLGDLLRWIATTGTPGVDKVMPGNWAQSKQLEHPYGWLVLELRVKT